MRSVWRSNLLALALIAAGAVAVSSLRWRLDARFSAVKIQNDVYALPPAKQLAALSLGYRSALADLIFANVLVSTGIHIQERRPFEFVGDYLDAVSELDPKFRTPYLMADALITLQAQRVKPEKFRQARRILERGMREFPFDQALWANAGQFFAYLGGPNFDDPKEQAEWQLAGGRTLARACELVGSNQDLPYQCVIAAGLLTRAGADAASRQFLERMLLVSDDPQIRALVSGQLQKAVGAEEKARTLARQQAFQRDWGADLPFASRGALLTIGPHWDAAACAGLAAKCATSWRALATMRDGLPGATTSFEVGASATP